MNIAFKEVEGNKSVSLPCVLRWTGEGYPCTVLAVAEFACIVIDHPHHETGDYVSGNWVVWDSPNWETVSGTLTMEF